MAFLRFFFTKNTGTRKWGGGYSSPKWTISVTQVFEVFEAFLTKTENDFFQGSRGSITELLGQEYLQNQARAGNPRRGSAIGS